MKKSGGIYIGTSGWHYGHWRGPFYPEGLSAAGMLGYAAERFNTVEINNSFYRLPEEKTLVRWRETVPEGFVFSAKASRLITHNKKLKDPQTTLPAFLERIEALGDKLGPILFQAPPRFRVNLERLESFLSALPSRFRPAFEFRDASWFDQGVFDALKRHNAAFCIYDFNYLFSPRWITADFAYIRLHGPDGPYRGRYGADFLAGLARDISNWKKKLKAVYCYFDNDEAGYAALDALRLSEFVFGKAAGARPAA